MRTILLLLICTMLGSSATYAEKLSPRKLTPQAFACEYLEIDCTGIKPANVVYTGLMGYMGLYGMYIPEEDLILIDLEAPAHTLVHEVTHHVLWHAGLRNRCLSEEAARRVHHEWEGTPYNDDWRVQYGCPL